MQQEVAPIDDDPLKPQKVRQLQDHGHHLQPHGQHVLQQLSNPEGTNEEQRDEALEEVGRWLTLFLRAHACNTKRV